MKREFSLAHLTVIGCAPPEMTYMASMAGYDYVSLRPIFMNLPGEPNYDLAANKEMFKQTKRAMNDTGVKLLDIELARVFEEMDLDKYRAAMEIGAELGGKHVLSSIWTEDRAFYMDKFGEVCDAAKEFGLTVDLEFVPIAGVNTLTGVVDVIDTVKRDNAGIMIDMNHFHRALSDKPEEKNSIEVLQSLPRELFHFAHLCDAPAGVPTDRENMISILREGRLYCGEGGIDIANIIDSMPLMPYSIELPNQKYVDEFGYAEHARRCLQTAKDYLDANSKLLSPAEMTAYDE